ncbi:MAG: hypothetical protein E7311_06515 [Clostridiales bacterium]|nr:hypothetical protein [Clostridiales bacterium]
MYSAFISNIEGKNIVQLKPNEKKFVRELFWTILENSRVYFSEEYLEFVKPMFNYVYQNEKNELILENARFHEGLSIRVQEVCSGESVEKAYALRQIKSTGIDYIPKKEGKGVILKLKKIHK